MIDLMLYINLLISFKMLLSVAQSGSALDPGQEQLGGLQAPDTPGLVETTSLAQTFLHRSAHRGRVVLRS